MRRGQVSAPIELFVAVIILAMSMALAFTVMRQSSENKCLAEVKSNLRQMEAAIVDVAIGSPPTTREIELQMPVCETRAVDAVRVVFYNNPLFCQACPGQYGGCWRLEPVSKDGQGNFHDMEDAAVCVNIAGKILLVDESVGLPQSGIPADEKCTALSDTPCPATLCDPPGIECEAFRNCVDDPQKSNVPPVKWTPSETGHQNTTYQTIGKVGNTQKYRVRLRKSISVSGTEEVGTINICVKPAYQQVAEGG